MARPTLSVVVPTFNHGHYLVECLDAIITQSAPPLETLVVDDGSQDGTSGLVDAFVARGAPVRLLRNPVNRGFFDAVKWGVSEAAGDCFAIHAADDVWLPGFTERGLALLDAHPQAGLFCCDPAYFDAPAGARRHESLHWSDRPGYLPPGAFASVLAGRAIAGHTVIIRRSAFFDAGGFRPELEWYTDWLLWLTVACRRGICYAPETLAAMRLDASSLSATGRRDRSRRRGVLHRLLHTLRSPEFDDVRELWVQGDVLAPFGEPVVDVALADPALACDPAVAMLLRLPLMYWQPGPDYRAGEALTDRTRAAAARRLAAFGSAGLDMGMGRWRAALGRLARFCASWPDDVEGQERLAAIGHALGKPALARRHGQALSGRRAGNRPDRHAASEAASMRGLHLAAERLACGAWHEANRAVIALLDAAPGQPDRPAALATLLRSPELGAAVADIVTRLLRATPPETGDRMEYDHVREVAIFGCGVYGRLALELAVRCGWDVCCFLDNDASWHGREVLGRPVLPPESLAAREVDLVVIATVAGRAAVSRQLDALGLHDGDDYVFALDTVHVGSVDLRLTVRPAAS
jgi:hypothetical protein